MMHTKELLWALGIAWGVMALVGCEARANICGSGYHTIVENENHYRTVKCGKLGAIGEKIGGNVPGQLVTIIDVYEVKPCSAS